MSQGPFIGWENLLHITFYSAKQALLRYRSASSETMWSICFVVQIREPVVETWMGKAPIMVSFLPSATPSERFDLSSMDLSIPDSFLRFSPSQSMEQPVSAMPSLVAVLVGGRVFMLLFPFRSWRLSQHIDICTVSLLEDWLAGVLHVHFFVRLFHTKLVMDGLDSTGRLNMQWVSVSLFSSLSWSAWSPVFAEAMSTFLLMQTLLKWFSFLHFLQVFP